MVEETLDRTVTQDAASSASPGGDLDGLRMAVIDALRGVYDPEIPVNIYELGLIYRCDVSADGKVEIDMTLTAPACPASRRRPGRRSLG